MSFTRFDPRPFVCRQYSQKNIIELKSIFDQINSNKCGVIIPKDLEQCFKQQQISISRQLLYEIGGLNFSEFLQLLKSSTQKQSRGAVKKIFDKFDRKGKGYIVEEDIARILCQVDQAREELDLYKLGAKQGKLYFEQFYNAITKDKHNQK